MIIAIKITKEDYEAIGKMVMTVGELHETLKGRVVRDILRGIIIDDNDHDETD